MTDSQAATNLEPVKAYVRTLAAGLCDFPDQIEIETSLDERGVLIKVFANKADLGRLIGKKGETVNGIRSILRALGAKNDARYSLKVDDADNSSSDTRSVLSIE